jgi:hypothetical protein
MDLKGWQIGAGVATLAGGGFAIWYFLIRQPKPVEPAAIKNIATGKPPAAKDVTGVSMVDLRNNPPPPPKTRIDPDTGKDTTTKDPSYTDTTPIIVVGAVPPSDIPRLTGSEAIKNYIVDQSRKEDHPSDIDKWFRAQIEGLDPNHTIRKTLEA